MMCTAVSSPQPPPMNASNVTASGSFATIDAGLEVDLLRPAAEQPLGRRIGDAVDAARRAARRRAMHGARQAAPARAMHVEERDAIAFGERPPFDVRERSANGVERAGRDVARDNRIRHARQPAVPQVHVGAADFRTRGAQQRGARRQIGTRKLRQARSAAAARFITTRRECWSAASYVTSLNGC